MLDRPPRAKRPTLERIAPPAPPELPERANGDFERRHGLPVVVRGEMIRVTMHARFLGRWSAP
ncbi:MAG: hypothetical protein ABI592_07400 [Acidobacteriota bacterium]